MARNGDRWHQATFEVTGVAKTLWSYAAGEPKDPIDIKIQNTHATATIYVNLSGSATVSDTMYKILPGGSFDFVNLVNDISVIGSIASNIVPYLYCKNGG